MKKQTELWSMPKSTLSYIQSSNPVLGRLTRVKDASLFHVPLLFQRGTG